MLVILDLGLGNLGSIRNMVKKAGGDPIVSADERQIERASQLILPGVGAFDYGVRQIQKSGVASLLRKKVLESKIPILGICLGMQLFTSKSEEGELPGLGWIDAETVRFPAGDSLKVPHMGWNEVKVKKSNRVLGEQTLAQRFYFVHSYYVQCRDVQNVWLTTRYDVEFASGIRKDNIYGVQFHPEKSHQYGMQLIKNFINLN